MFTFVSEGPNGNISKLIKYTRLRAASNVFNLAFGDIDPITKELRDDVTSNNGDTDKVLATVAVTVLFLTEENPEIWIYAKGSSSARTRLYQMAISRNLEAITEIFDIFGITNYETQNFERGINYDAFLVKRKELKSS